MQRSKHNPLHELGEDFKNIVLHWSPWQWGLGVGFMFLDMFTLSKSVLAFLPLFYGILALVVAVFSWMFGYRRWRDGALRTGIICVVLASMSMQLVNIHNSVYTPWVQERLVAACAQYEQEHDHYPPNLDALTPDYIWVVPPAKLSLLWIGYRYKPGVGEDYPYLGWHKSLQDVHRYNFNKDVWSHDEVFDHIYDEKRK